MVGDEIVALPSDHGYIAAHPGAIAAFDFIGAFSALPTPMETDMTKHIHIPPEAVEAAARAIATMEGAPEAWVLRQVRATAAIRAALENWPGVKLENLCGWVMDGPDLPYVEETASIILPLITEKTDD